MNIYQQQKKIKLTLFDNYQTTLNIEAFMKKHCIKILVLFALSFSSCTQSEKNLIIDLNKEYQTIHSFGASDAWRCQFIGKNWPEEKKKQMAQWLFSKETDSNGNPLGIGLSLWRFNIGAGSMEQGKNSHITNPWRKAECFLNEDGSYDWTKQSGQQWFLAEAKKYGVEYFLAFPNSPPIHLTLNGQAYSDKNRTHLNIKNDKLEEYAKFLTEVCTHFEELDLGFHYLSPINEPQWDWSTPTQEGTPASNEEMYLLTKKLNKEFIDRKLKTQITLGEAAEYKFLTQTETKYRDSSNQLEVFWTPSSPFYLGGLKSVAPLFSGHSYFTSWPVKELIKNRELLRQRLDQIEDPISFWQSEFCILEENDDITSGHKRDLGMGTALYVARVMHNDLAIANSTSWHWWTAITQVDYKDGLIYLDNGNDGITDQQHPDNETLQHNGQFQDSKLMWAIGNYSRFVRPGMIRVDVSIEGSVGSLEEAESSMITAFKNTGTNELTIVAINYSTQEHHINLTNKKDFNSEVKSYTTSNTGNLQFCKTDVNGLSLPAQSVKTFILNY